jgi:hypothetical protein
VRQAGEALDRGVRRKHEAPQAGARYRQADRRMSAVQVDEVHCWHAAVQVAAELARKSDTPVA